jgi:hypothetical protein
MGSMRTCDCSGCPAIALHHVDLYGQDFHFCHHHWVALAPSMEPHLGPASGGVAVGVAAG